MTTFIDKCIIGTASPSELDDYIDLWHLSVVDDSFYEFLGLTKEECKLWITLKLTIEEIINGRIQ